MFVTVITIIIFVTYFFYFISVDDEQSEAQPAITVNQPAPSRAAHHRPADISSYTSEAQQYTRNYVQ